MKTLSNGIDFRIKWACAHLPYVDFDDGVNVSTRVFLQKTDVITIIKEMQEFVEYYADEFSDEKINLKYTE